MDNDRFHEILNLMEILTECMIAGNMSERERAEHLQHVLDSLQELRSGND